LTLDKKISQFWLFWVQNQHFFTFHILTIHIEEIKSKSCRDWFLKPSNVRIRDGFFCFFFSLALDVLLSSRHQKFIKRKLFFVPNDTVFTINDVIFHSIILVEPLYWDTHSWTCMFILFKKKSFLTL
jgi:hypothetical protein